MSETTTPSLPTIGSPAPAFHANSTHGEISLDTYDGKWIVLFSHPADFTPVCSTEFVAFANRASQFEEKNVQLIGLSIDSVYAHIAWMRNLEATQGIKVTFPVIADKERSDFDAERPTTPFLVELLDVSSASTTASVVDAWLDYNPAYLGGGICRAVSPIVPTGTDSAVTARFRNRCHDAERGVRSSDSPDGIEFVAADVR